MSRLTMGFLLAAALAGTAVAESQAEIASKLNEEGKDLMFAGKFHEASEKFQQAVARVPEAKYFFNLCTSLYQEGKFPEAWTACQSVDKNSPDDKLKQKTAKLEQKIQSDADAQHIALAPTGGGGGETNVGTTDTGATTTGTTDTGTTGTTTTGTTDTGATTTGTTDTGATATGTAQPVAQSTVVGHPTQNLIAAAPPQHSYVWTLGVDTYAAAGRIGGMDGSGNNYYGNGGIGLRVKSDYLLDASTKIGGQGYIQLTDFGPGATTAMNGIGIYDIGLAGYKHVCPGTGRLCLTPLLGVQLSVLTPGGNSASIGSYVAIGGRGELNLSLALGPHYEHVLQAMLGLNIYSAAFASPDPASGLPQAADVGLDRASAFGYLGVGYTYRFNTPLGATPFITLE